MTCALVIVALSLVAITGMWASVRLGKKSEVPAPTAVHPCSEFHFYEPIAARRIDGLMYNATSLLSRCRVCKQCKSEAFAGDFELIDFQFAGAAELERMMR